MFAVRVDLRLPRGEIAASRGSDADHSHEDVHVAVRDAFVALERQLTRGAQRRPWTPASTGEHPGNWRAAGSSGERLPTPAETRTVRAAGVLG